MNVQTGRCLTMVAIAVTIVSAARDAGAAGPRFAEVDRILRQHCTVCHSPDGDGPFRLTTYEDARRHAIQIETATRTRFMPPWKPAPGGERFLGERRLSDAEIDTIAAWVRAGAPGPATSPGTTERAASRAHGWLHGEPDLVIELPEYSLRADGPDVFRNFVVTVPGRETRYVRGFQFRPRNRAVHHANIRIDPTPASRQLDEADPAPGYEGTILHSADYPDGQFLGWTPGQAPPPNDPTLAWSLRGGSDFVVQLHMRPSGKPEIIRPEIGLYFGTKPSTTPSIVRLGRQNIDIPAGASDVSVTDSFVLPVEAEVHAIQPHAHYRATAVTVWATPPAAPRRQILRIDDWDMNWQDQYRYATPFRLPAGTTIEMAYRFDNSTRNPRNPDRPPQRVTWGWRSADEMADVWIQVLTRTPEDRARLQRTIEAKMLAEDAVGGERLIEREPDHAALRNDLASTYMALGQPLRALTHFQQVTRLNPESAAAWFNEGVALESAGRRAEAHERYEHAIGLNATYAAAHNNLAALLLNDGRVTEARAEFERAVASDPSSGDAQANLALLLAQAGDIDAALSHMSSARGLMPLPFKQMTPFIWLLAAHHDAASRRPPAALELAEQLVTATRRGDPVSLDALGIALASLGRFDEAAAAARAALAFMPANADDIRVRLALYTARRPFVLQE